MLRKRTRSVEKDQPMGHDVGSESEVLGNDKKFNSIFNIPGLFVGLSPKGLSDSDSLKSPTSPLDFRVFSNLCNSPRSPFDRHQKIWDKTKVGLSIVDSLDNDSRVSHAPRPSESKNILLGPQMRIMTSNCPNHIHSFESPKSLPANFAIFPQTLTKSRLQRGNNNSDVVFEIADTPLGSEHTRKAISCSLDSGSIRSQTKPNSMPSEIELSEDYTCVTSHGPKPKTTHIYGDRILDCKVSNASNFEITEELDVKVPLRIQCLENLAPYPSNDFLSFCYTCNKKLEDGKDIYIYRGEKAFCTSECRLREIMMDEELEKEYSMNTPELDKDDEVFEAGILVVT